MERARERILAAFSSKAKRSGIRAVVMGELATELRMSPMTLYKHFASKDELVSAMVDAWALELAAIEALDLGQVEDCNTALERLLAWADSWTSSLANVSPSFFKDLHRDHPECWRRFQAQIEERKWAAAPFLAPFLRPDLDSKVALIMLDYLVTKAADPRYAERLGVSRQEAVRTAVSIWGGGALLHGPKLRAVRAPGVPRPR
ncbi:MAG TPA: TetR/AcrR family transcriptional regulator [Myxococcota bacterium]|jgi:AcrR family transcriptional regulator|nr:TetR/AcrR family transcriptional regulator [Myxococcota bacterium]